MNAAAQLKTLRKGRIDVGVVAMPAEEADVALTAEEPLLIVTPDLEPYLRGQMIRLFRGRGLSPRVAQEANQIDPAGPRLRARRRGPYAGPRPKHRVGRRGDGSPALEAFLDTIAEVPGREA